MSCNAPPLPPTIPKPRRLRTLTPEILTDVVGNIIGNVLRIVLTPTFDSGVLIDLFLNYSGEALEKKWKEYVDSATADVYIKLVESSQNAASMKIYQSNGGILLLDRKLTTVVYATVFRTCRPYLDNYFPRYYEMIRANAVIEGEDEEDIESKENFEFLVE